METESDIDSDSSTREKYKGGDEKSSNSESESKKSGAECCLRCCPENGLSKSKFAGVLAPLFSPTLASDMPFK